MDRNPIVHLSIVSHRQGELVRLLLDDIEEHCADVMQRVTVTVNVPEPVRIEPSCYSFPLVILENSRPRGFGANHNAAFRSGSGATGMFFCVINPDVRIREDVFSPLLRVFGEMSDVGVVAPRVTNPGGTVEDSARRFPKPWTPLRRALLGRRTEDSLFTPDRYVPDWVAGMFMLLPVDLYRELGGFDERYFLYYEDVELCGRVWLSGRCVVVEPSVSILHDARRDSHRKFRYLLWHIRGVLRFFTSATYWRLTLRGVRGRRRTTG